MKSRELFETFFYPLVRINEIYRSTDEQGDLVVYEFKDYRALTFGSVFEQSRVRIHQPLQLEHEYTQAMLLPLMLEQPRHVTLLGLGAGVLASYLFHSFDYLLITAVEWRESVIDIAHEFFSLPVDARLHVIHDDAGRYIATVEHASTDWILSDLFTADAMSDVQLQADFYRNCFDALSERGWLVLNFHGSPSIECPAMRAVSAQFSSVFMITVRSGNRIVLACKNTVQWPKPGQALPAGLPIELADAFLRLHARIISLGTS